MKISRGALFLLASSCGSSSDGPSHAPACTIPLNGSCTHRTGLFCTEYAGVPEPALTAIISSCTRVDSDGKQGTWSTAGCARTNAVGGCTQSQGGTCVAAWFYAGDAAGIMSQCASQGGTWVNP
jgi:hypothetical protein